MTLHPVPTPTEMLAVALAAARTGYEEGGVPVGAALFGPDGELLGSGQNRRVQDGDPATHGETAAFRAAGRRPDYAGTTMVTTLSPCFFCAGLIRQFRIPRLVVGEARTFGGQHAWLAEHGVEVTLLDDPECAELMSRFAKEQPETWLEDIGGPE
ncbi:nucleoside deaminase [Actinomycetospora termitidis]|uniref:Nucleoside deaminase n=1 Tax=Actinomycetospora termitidis TaxID=3053470 RepID=A0ABT7M3H9_9PSEU|nr:nucleoside deaminase [Actinomycetospora sp. Odt1-22]MDL5155227.1 nucleoside deaminase [Actinomycetospora sp. Odt1-22]